MRFCLKSDFNSNPHWAQTLFHSNSPRFSEQPCCCLMICESLTICLAVWNLFVGLLENETKLLIDLSVSRFAWQIVRYSDGFIFRSARMREDLLATSRAKRAELSPFNQKRAKPSDSLLEMQSAMIITRNNEENKHSNKWNRWIISWVYIDLIN